MPDNTNQGEPVKTPESTVNTEPAKDTITSEERAELETLRKSLELSKNEISTRDKKLTELQKELKTRMTDVEQAKMQADEERREWLADIAKTKADALQLDEKHAGLIKGNSKEEINQSAELVKSLLDNVNKEKDKIIKALEDKIKILEANGTPPAAGNQAPAGSERQRLIAEYNEAEKKGDGSLMFSLKERIRKLPKD